VPLPEARSRAEATPPLKPPAAPLAPDASAGSAAYLDRMERELASWSARLALACDRPRKLTRAARLEQRKRILVSKVRHRNLAGRLAEMRTGEARFHSLQPGLLQLWEAFTSGIEQAES